MNVSVRKVIVLTLCILLLAIIFYTLVLIQKEKKNYRNEQAREFLVHKEPIVLTNNEEADLLSNAYSVFDVENDIKVSFEYFPNLTQEIVEDVYSAISQSLSNGSENIVKVLSITDKKVEFEYWDFDTKEIIKHIL